MSKKLIVIIGPNGVGKTTTAIVFKDSCPRSAYIDADWCRSINPFHPLTEATKELVISNIFCLMKNHLLCADIETIVFPYAFHGERKEIFDAVIARLREADITFDLKIVILKCSYEENVRRAREDKRDEERIQRGMRLTHEFYDNYEYPMIDTTDLTPEEVAECVMKFV